MDTQYLGTCWTSFEKNGKVELTKLHLYHIRGERRYALTEEAARSAVATALREGKR